MREMKIKGLKSLIATILMASAVLISCDKDEDNLKVQLLETISYDGKLRQKFEYDDQYRISKIINYQDIPNENVISYIQMYSYDSDGDLISVYYDLNQDDVDINYLNTIPKPFENKIITNGTTIELNNEGLPIKIENRMEFGNGDIGSSSEVIEYENGNIKNSTFVSVRTGNDPWTIIINNLAFDDKKTPFYNCTTPKWALVQNFGNIQNNILLQTVSNSHNPVEESEVITHTYTYDTAGFPKTKNGVGWFENEEISYTYIKR